MRRERVAAAALVLLTPSLAAQQFARASREAMPRNGPPSGARSSLVDLAGMPVALQAVLFDGVRLHLTPVEHEIVRS